MRGSLRHRGGDSWQLRVYLGVDAVTARQRWATTTVHGTKRYATCRLAEFVEQAGRARIRAGTVADLLTRWMEVSTPRWSPSTLRQNRSVVVHHLVPLLGHLRVDDVFTTDIDDLYRHLLVRGGAGAAPLTAGTVARIHGVLRRAFTQAVRWEWVWFNPVSGASPPRAVPSEITPPTAQQVAELLAAVESSDPAFHAYLRLAASTGARRSQMLGVRWAEVDFEHSSIGFHRAWVEGVDGPVLRPTKTHRSYRVAIDAATIAILTKHRQRHLDRSAATSGGLVASGFVFSDDIDGRQPWLPNRVTKRFIDSRRRANLGHFRLHDLRHFMATEMLANGVPVSTVSQRLGHARASTTLNVYAHRIPGADCAAADLMAEILRRSSPVQQERAPRVLRKQWIR